MSLPGARLLLWIVTAQRGRCGIREKCARDRAPALLREWFPTLGTAPPPLFHVFQVNPGRISPFPAALGENSGCSFRQIMLFSPSSSEAIAHYSHSYRILVNFKEELWRLLCYGHADYGQSIKRLYRYKECREKDRKIFLITPVIMELFAKRGSCEFPATGCQTALLWFAACYSLAHK